MKDRVRPLTPGEWQEVTGMLDSFCRALGSDEERWWGVEDEDKRPNIPESQTLETRQGGSK